MKHQERVFSADGNAEDFVKNQHDIDLAFDAVRKTLVAMQCELWSVVVNYNLRGFDHFSTTYPEEWTTEYVNKNYAYLDPTLQWAMWRQGAIRWSEIRLPDPLGVLKRAKKQGLNYGATISRKTGKKRTMIFAARSDREFSDPELDQLQDVANPFFDAVSIDLKLNSSELETIRLLVEGESVSAIAEQLNISDSAVKTRLFSARKKMGAKNNAQLVFKVGENNLL